MLDAGCGPGRFAIHLAQSGYSLTLVDISQHQLDQARDHLEAAGFLARVQAFHCLDILDLHSLHDASFDAVVCYGGAISYTYDRYKAALEELARVVRPGGVLLISVFSLYGSYRLIGPYDGVDALMPPEEHIDWQAMLTGADVLLTNPESINSISGWRCSPPPGCAARWKPPVSRWWRWQRRTQSSRKVRRFQDQRK